MQRNHILLLAASLTLLIGLAAPDLAIARAGGGHSSGSRGSHTYSPTPSTNAQPVQRSVTPPPPQQQAQPVAPPRGSPYQPVAPMAAPVGHPFLRGIAGGLVGAGIAHMLFGGSAMGEGYGMGGGGGGFGSSFGLLHFILIGLAIWFAVRFFRSRGMGGDAGFGGMFQARQPAMSYSSSGPDMIQASPVSQPLQLMNSDRDAFTRTFTDIQAAWNTRSMDKLQALMTPEMVQYFSQELSTNISQGVVNHVEDAAVDSIDQVESWTEDNLSYATVVMRWHARDYTVRIDSQPGDANRLVSGSDNAAEAAQEQWTFVRAAGGRWLLSAIQQMN